MEGLLLDTQFEVFVGDLVKLYSGQLKTCLCGGHLFFFLFFPFFAFPFSLTYFYCPMSSALDRWKIPH